MNLEKFGVKFDQVLKLLRSTWVRTCHCTVGSTSVNNCSNFLGVTQGKTYGRIKAMKIIGKQCLVIFCQKVHSRLLRGEGKYTDSTSPY